MLLVLLLILLHLALLVLLVLLAHLHCRVLLSLLHHLALQEDQSHFTPPQDRLRRLTLEDLARQLLP